MYEKCQENKGFFDEIRIPPLRQILTKALIIQGFFVAPYFRMLSGMPLSPRCLATILDDVGLCSSGLFRCNGTTGDWK
jgi:hypothetical protein